MFIKEKRKKRKKGLLVVNQRGVVLLYGLILFHVVSLFCGMLVQKVRTNTIAYNNDFFYVEIYSIHKAKNDLKDYEEMEETISYLGYEIQFVYDDITCYITIYDKGGVILQSKLEYDDIELQVVDYVYL